MGEMKKSSTIGEREGEGEGVMLVSPYRVYHHRKKKSVTTTIDKQRIRNRIRREKTTTATTTNIISLSINYI